MQVDYLKEVCKRWKLMLAAPIFLFISGKINAQETERYTDAWFLLLNHYQVNEKWTIGNEFHWRSTNFLDDKQQLILRPYVNYKKNDNVVFTVGYSYLRSYPYAENAVPATRPEHNFWEQVTLNHRSSKLSFSHRYRIEHRFSGNLVQDNNGDFIVDDYRFSNRFRYRITLKHPIGENYFMHVFDELWIRGNNRFRNVQFDRNWLYLGIGRKLSDNSNIQLAYLHQVIQANADLYEKHPTLQLTVQYDFKK